MKTNKFLTILTLVVLLAITATTVWAAASPYLIESFSMTDPLDPSVSWWRDTANQNAIAQHSADEFTGTVSQVYSTSKLKVLVYSSIGGPNVTALVGPSSWWLVGPGGGRDEANTAKMAFQAFYPTFSTKTLKGILLTGASPEEAWGATFWRNAFRTVPPAPIYASAAYPDARASWEVVAKGYSARYMNAIRPFPDIGPNGRPVTDWDPDGFLGAGSMNQYAPALTFYTGPDQLISTTTSFNIDGAVPLNLIPGPGASLMVQLPDQAILIGGDFGKYLPEAASIYQPGLSAADRIALLNQMLALNPAIYAPLHGQPVSGNAAIVAALTAQRDALQSILDQTIAQINQGATIDEAAAAVALPADLASSPYNQEFVSTVPAIVKAVYQEKMGWFGGNPTELASTLTETAKAQALVDAFGLDTLIAAARNAELSAQDLPSAEKALYLAYAAAKAAPDDSTVQAIYAQALRKNAYLQKSAQVRNTYLSVAQFLGWEPDFTKTGLQDTPITFTLEDFSTRFTGFIGMPPCTFIFASVPPAETGILTEESFAGRPQAVIPGLEFDNLIYLDTLVFTPAAGWTGTTSFTWYTMDDAGYVSAEATVTLQVTRANHAPVAAIPLSDVTVDEDAVSSAIDLSSVFSDADGDPLTYTIENSNTGLVAATLDGALLTLAYAANANGAATITVTATDTAGASASDDFAVTVNPLNDAPTAADASITVVVGQSQTVSLDYGDLETAQANLTVAFGSLNGSLDASALPALTYTAPAAPGDDSFTYTVTDRGDPDGCTEAPCAAALSATATVHVTVLPESSISGLVFNDANGNGTNDEEAGLAGVTVQLQNPDGSLVASTATGGDGTYAFAALQPGAYRVRQVLSAGYLQTTPDPADVTVDTGGAVTGVDFGAVFSADLKVAMTSAYNAKSKVITYTIVVTNDGPADAAASAMIDNLSGTVSFLSVTTSQGACTGGKTVACDFGTLANGSSVTVVIKVDRLNTKAAITNTATVSSSIFDIDMADNSATVTTP